MKRVGLTEALFQWMVVNIFHNKLNLTGFLEKHEQ